MRQQEQRLFAILSLIVAVCACIAAWIVIVPLIRPLFGSPTPTPESFDYQVRVQVQGSGIPIQNAHVIIDIGGGIAPKEGYTDANGFARIFIDAARTGKAGRLIVEAIGYVNYTRNIDLINGVLPEVVQ